MHTATPTHIATPTHFAGNPIAFDARTTTGWATNPTSPVTFAHTCSGSDRILFVFIHCNGGNGDATTGATYNGVALTQLCQDDGTFAQIEAWYLVNPSVGTHDVVVTKGNNAGAPYQIVAESFTGVDQTNPINATNVPDIHATGSSMTRTVAPTVSNCMIIDAFTSLSTNSCSANAPQTEKWNVCITNNVSGGSIKANGTSMTWGHPLVRPNALLVIALTPKAQPIHSATPNHFS
jgi:hypothetical protein